MGRRAWYFCFHSGCFALWAIQMFRVLFHLRARDEAKTGQYLGGPVTFLRSFRNWLSDPAVRTERFILALLTMVLLLSIVTFATFAALHPRPGSELVPQ